jgi:hypothetical protein
MATLPGTGMLFLYDGELLLDGFRQRSIHIARMPCRDCFNKHDPALLLCDRIVQCAFRYHIEIARVESDFVVFELKDQTTVNDKEHLIFGIVLMPGELPLQLRDLHILVVDSSNDAWRPVLRNLFQSLQKVH